MSGMFHRHRTFSLESEWSIRRRDEHGLPTGTGRGLTESDVQDSMFNTQTEGTADTRQRIHSCLERANDQFAPSTSR